MKLGVLTPQDKNQLRAALADTLWTEPGVNASEYPRHA